MVSSSFSTLLAVTKTVKETKEFIQSEFCGQSGNGGVFYPTNSLLVEEVCFILAFQVWFVKIFEIFVSAYEYGVIRKQTFSSV